MTAPAAASYADVVAALVDAREAPATERFDALVTAAVAAGTLEPELARTLRWWQRASVRECADHAKAVLPAVFAALAESAAAATATAEATGRAWTAAGGAEPRPAAPVARPTPGSAASRRRLVVAGLTDAGLTGTG